MALKEQIHRLCMRGMLGAKGHKKVKRGKICQSKANKIKQESQC